MTKLLKTTLILAICGLFAGWTGVCYAVDSFTENWDAYADNTDITTITSWVELYSTETDAKTTSTKTYSGTRSVKQTTTSVLHSGHLINAGNGSYEIFTRMNAGTQNYGVALYASSLGSFYNHFFAFNFVYNNLQFKENSVSCAWDTIDATALNLTWVDLKMIWRYVGTDILITPYVNGNSYGEQNCGTPAHLPDYITFYTNYSTGSVIYFDDVIYDNAPYFPPVVYITSPESGSTITDDSTELVGGWTNIDSGIWTNIKIAFNDLQITETSGLVNVPITDDNGTFEIPLSDFAIPNNGGWNLRAVVENNYEYNFDIPNPPYNLIFDIEGYSTPYEFDDFETWYSENVEDYEDPSTWAMNLTGFMNPIFEKIGQFGNRINSYLDVSTGYEKGLQIGSVFPVIGAYVLKIDLFFGGFPMVQFFKWGILIMIGLFAVKIILKLLAFIPFIGGGG